MIGADLAGRIRLGEDSALELKSLVVKGGRVGSPDRRDFADELAAMANGRGGTVVLGVVGRVRVSPRLRWSRTLPRGSRFRRADGRGRRTGSMVIGRERDR